MQVIENLARKETRVDSKVDHSAVMDEQGFYRFLCTPRGKTKQDAVEQRPAKSFLVKCDKCKIASLAHVKQILEEDQKLYNKYLIKLAEDKKAKEDFLVELERRAERTRKLEAKDEEE
jgi:hypothetical protein